MIGASQYQVLMLAINIGWILYNLIILFASIAVCVESVQQRKFPRVAAMQKVTVELSDGHKVKAVCLRPSLKKIVSWYSRFRQLYLTSSLVKASS